MSQEQLICLSDVMNHHDDCVNELIDKNYEQICGVKAVSGLCSLEANHIVRMLPPDISHDLAEGIVPYELNLALKRFIKEKNYFSFEYLQKQIRDFPFGQNDRPNITDFYRPTLQNAKL